MAKRITIQLIGAADDKGNLRLGDFVDQLNSIKRALYERERLVSGADRPHIEYNVVDLHHSEATIVLEPVALNGVTQDRKYVDRVVTGFSDELRIN